MNTRNITDEELQRAIDNLVRQGKVERITMPNGEPGVRLIRRENDNGRDK